MELYPRGNNNIQVVREMGMDMYVTVYGQWPVERLE